MAVKADHLSAPMPLLPANSGRPAVFEGLKVVDFTWAAAGPITTMNLADHGAIVVKVESSVHPDSVRNGGPFAGGKPGINRSGFFAGFNHNKLSVTIDMTTEPGRAVAKRLLTWADVVVESFTPRVMPGWGFGYDDLRKLNPRLIMLSTCMLGQTGPYRSYAGFGAQGAALAGFPAVNGWADRSPAAPFGAYTDMITPYFAISALVAALDYRDRTGQGQHIDVSQVEAGFQLLAPRFVQYSASGQVPARMGDRSYYAAPHGAFQCAGDDNWIAIAVETDEQWQALKGLMGNPAWSADPRYDDLGGRLASQDEMRQRIEYWTAPQDRFELMARLQAVGIPSGAVQKALDLFDDPQLQHRKHHVPLVHPEMGVCLYSSLPYRLSETPGELLSAAPCIGEHTYLVLREFLAYGEEEIEALEAEGALK